MSESNITILESVPSLGLANRIMDRCLKNHILDVTNMKIQKLCYYTYAYFYKEYDRLLFAPNKIMFWKFGPVITRVYDSLKHFQANPITSFIQHTDNETDYRPVDIKNIKNNEDYDNIIEVINRVISKIGYKTALQLKDLSHQDYTAWYKITDNGKDINQTLTEENLPLLKTEVEKVFE